MLDKAFSLGKEHENIGTNELKIIKLCWKSQLTVREFAWLKKEWRRFGTSLKQTFATRCDITVHSYV